MSSDVNIGHEIDDIDEMWLEYGKRLGLDNMAKFMIITCATLIVVQLGLSYAFQNQAFSLLLTSQFFLVISAAFFAMALHQIGRARVTYLQTPASIRDLYIRTTKTKTHWHLFGFSFFVAGLLAFAIMTLVQ